MSKVEVLDLTVICRNFPDLPSQQIHRDHLLDTIDKIFEGDTHLIVVEGEEGFGKTTLVAQFAKRHHNHAFSLFIKPTCRLAYAPEYLCLDLSEQLYWTLNKETMRSEVVEESFLRTQWPILQRRARNNRETYYFIIDGIIDIPGEDSRIKDIILKEILPLGIPGFKFLLTGSLEKFDSAIHKSVSRKSFPLSPFSLDETERYLKDLNLERESLENIHKMCRGVPGHLTIVRRMLQSGTSIQSILDEEPDKLPEFVAIEWRKTENADVDQRRILAILAYGRKEYTLDEIARILSMESNDIESFLKDGGIVTIEPQKKVVNFVSEAHRRYAASKLRAFKEEINNILIDDLLKDATSATAIQYLPGYYEQAGKLNELLEYLTPEHFTKVLESSQSLSPVYHRAEMGLSTARKLNRNEELMRFSLQKSIITELDGAEVWQSEIKARMALKDYESAMLLAQNTVLKEDRLHLLAIIAKIKREHGLMPEPELMERIQLLYDQINPKTLGKRAAEIASDLICSNPDLAIKMVEICTDTNEDENALDWAFARLSIAALDADRGLSQATDAIEKTRSRIKDPLVHEFSRAAAVFFGECSAAAIIEHVNKLETKNRLYFLRHWILVNQKRDDIADVIDYSLDFLIKNTPYTPKTRDLREIATPLPFISDSAKARQLVGRFDSQKGAIEKLGTTEDYIRLQLLLAQAENKYDFEAAYNRVIEIYWFLDKIEDIITKAECLAWLISLLPSIDPELILEKKEGLCGLAQDELQTLIKHILDSSADHLSAARGIIVALAIAKPEMALNIAKVLNTQDRRDSAILELIKTVTSITVKELDMIFLEKALKDIADPDVRDEALGQIMRCLASAGEKVDPNIIENTLSLINAIKDIKDTENRCIACCAAYMFLSKQDTNRYDELSSEILKQLKVAWESIDVGWRKVDIGFKITRRLAANAPEIAKEYLKSTDAIKDDVIIDAEAQAIAYLLCIELSIRAYSGLLPMNLNKTEDLERIASLINRIPSHGERARLWADLSIRCFLNKHREICNQIVTESIKPLLYDISDFDNGYKTKVLIDVGPALFCTHHTTAIEMISKLPPLKRDEAYDRICEFILCKHPASDPYNVSPGNGFLLSYEDAIDICELLKLMNTDYNIYHNIDKIADSLVSKQNKNNFSKQQKADIADRLERIINNKLPDQQNIKHEGYKILALSHVARIRSIVERSAWENLITTARNIPNVADRALVLSIIATLVPSKTMDLRNLLVEEAKSFIKSIPVDIDRINRYLELAGEMVSLDSVMSKQCLKAAMEFSIKIDDPDLTYSCQRRVIDLAHKIDPSFAAMLASLCDDDPARLKTSKTLKKRIELLDLKEKMVNQQAQPIVDSAISKDSLPDAAWMNLGDLNSGRLKPIHFDHMRQFIEAAAMYPVHESYPIIAWIIENTIKRVARTDQAQTFLVPMFEATLLGAELAGIIAKRSLVQLKNVKSYITTASGSDRSMIIAAGQREIAIQFLKDWFSAEVRDYLKICDPYFGIEDLEVLQILHSVNPSCKVAILTSKKYQDKISPPWDEAFRNHWRIRVSAQNPPETEIAIVGIEHSGELPIHDRWWLTNGGGIRIGTSFNSLGITKSSEISILTTDEALLREKEVDQYLRREKREHNKEKLQYNLFTL